MEQKNLKPFLLQVIQELTECGATGIVEFEIQLDGATINFDININ